jgi:tetratricopeptide (TPR) repeat protein
MRYVLALTEGADEGLQTSEAPAWLGLLDRERDNVRAALSWVGETGQVDSELDVIARVWRVWILRGALHEGRRCVEGARARDTGEHRAGRAIALRVAAVLARLLGDLEAAWAYAQESLSLRRRLGDPGEIAHGLSFVATMAADRGDYFEAERLFEEAAVLGRGGETQTRAMLTGSLADVALRQGDFGRALIRAEESLRLFRELGRDDGASWALYNLGLSLFRTEQETGAVSAARECLEIAYRTGEVETLIWVFSLLAAIAARRERAEVEARLVGSAETLRTQSGFVLIGPEGELHDEIVQDLRLALGEKAYETALARGRAMSLDDAVELALSSID